MDKSAVLVSCSRGRPCRSCHRGARAVRCAALLAGLCYAVAVCVGCGSQERYRVEGSVTIDGRPLERALITFIPISPTGGPKATGVVSDGSYVIEQADGPCRGEFLVRIETVSHEIEAIAAGRSPAEAKGGAHGPRPTVAPEYNRNSRLRAVVREGADNRFDFQVESVQHDEPDRWPNRDDTHSLRSPWRPP